MVTLPNFSGRNAFNTFDEIKKLDLTYEEFPVYSETIPKGNVVKTEPVAGNSVISGSNVIVYVSQGPLEKTTRIPDLTGLDENEAKQLLDKYSLTLGKVTEKDSRSDKGEVIDQNPGVAEKVKTNTPVDITISSGKEPDDEDLSVLSINVWLPNIDKDVKMDAFIGKELMDTEVLNPLEEEKWTPRLEGRGEKDVKVFIDDKLYQVFEIDFDHRTADLKKDHSEKFND